MKDFRLMVIARIAELQKLIDNTNPMTNNDLLKMKYLKELIDLNKQVLICLQES